MKNAIAICSLLLMAHIAQADSMIPFAFGPRIGMKYTSPQEGSLPLGFMVADSDSAILLELEPGLHSGKLNLGWGYALLKSENFVFLKGSVLRTWDDPLNDVAPDTTYLGAELEFMGFRSIIVNIGIQTRVGGNDTSEETIISAGVGVADWKF
jgi:hypothetical protein